VAHRIKTRSYPIQTYLAALTIALILVIVVSLTLFATWNASNIQKEHSVRELAQSVKQGAIALQNYLEAQQATSTYGHPSPSWMCFSVLRSSPSCHCPDCGDSLIG
jgi:hypothetical protein